MGLFGRKIGVFKVTAKYQVKCTCGGRARLDENVPYKGNYTTEIKCSDHNGEGGVVMDVNGNFLRKGATIFHQTPEGYD